MLWTGYWGLFNILKPCLNLQDLRSMGIVAILCISYEQHRTMRESWVVNNQQISRSPYFCALRKLSASGFAAPPGISGKIRDPSRRLTWLKKKWPLLHTHKNFPFITTPSRVPMLLIKRGNLRFPHRSKQSLSHLLSHAKRIPFLPGPGHWNS